MEHLIVHDADIYIMNQSEAEHLTQEHCREHFPQRYERACRFLRRADYLRCIAAGELIHSVLGLEEQDIQISEHGKPYAEAADLYFSLSHSGDYIILAVSGRNVGADIEKIEPEHLRLANRVFARDEIEWLETASDRDRVKRFAQLWTLKESVSKLLGLGMSMDYSSFSVMPIIEGANLEICGRSITGASIEYDSYTLSVCTEL